MLDSKVMTIDDLEPLGKEFLEREHSKLTSRGSVTIWIACLIPGIESSSVSDFLRGLLAGGTTGEVPLLNPGAAVRKVGFKGLDLEFAYGVDSRPHVVDTPTPSYPRRQTKTNLTKLIVTFRRA